MRDRIISALLACCVAAGAVTQLIGCSESAEEAGKVTTETSGSETTEEAAETMPELPEFDFEGREFNIISRDDATSATWDVRDICAEEQNGDLINDAVYARNLPIEEKYNITIKQEKIATDSIPTSVSKAISAGDDIYDAIQQHMEQLSTMAVSGSLINLNKVEYLDLTQEWWAQSMMEDMSIGGKVFYATGDICLNDDKASWCILFNKTIAENNSVQDLYQTVRDGGWTLDLLHTIAAAVNSDLNGDGVMKLEDDLYGIYDQYECAAALFLASGVKCVDKDAEGNITYNLDSTEASTVFGRIYDFMSDTESEFIVDANSLTDPWNTIRTHYRASGALFYFTNIGALTMIRDMETDFGVLPVTKVDEAQDRYYNTFQYNNGAGYAVPMSATDTDRTGIILESMAMGSVATLTPAYFSSTLEIKAVRDEESIEMLKLIFDSRIFDISLAYATIGSMSFLQGQVKQTTNKFASSEASKRASFLAAIEKVTESLDKLGKR